MLDDLAAKPLIFLEAQPGVFAWMADMLFMSAIPASLIQREAGSRNSIWHRRLRKKKLNIAKMREAFMREQLAELGEDQHWQYARSFRLDVLRHHKQLERLIRLGRRLDPELKEVAVGWPQCFQVDRWGITGPVA
jgi:hypothetical protein